MSNNSTPRIDILIRSWPKLIASASKSKYDFQLKLVFLKHFNKHLISSTPVSTPCYSWVFIFKCNQTFQVENKLIRCNSIVSLLTSTGYKWLLWLNELDQCNLIYQKKWGVHSLSKRFHAKSSPKGGAALLWILLKTTSSNLWLRKFHQLNGPKEFRNWQFLQQILETSNFNEL